VARQAEGNPGKPPLISISGIRCNCERGNPSNGSKAPTRIARVGSDVSLSIGEKSREISSLTPRLSSTSSYQIWLRSARIIARDYSRLRAYLSRSTSQCVILIYHVVCDFSDPRPRKTLARSLARDILPIFISRPEHARTSSFSWLTEREIRRDKREWKGHSGSAGRRTRIELAR